MWLGITYFYVTGVGIKYSRIHFIYQSIFPCATFNAIGLIFISLRYSLIKLRAHAQKVPYEICKLYAKSGWKKKVFLFAFLSLFPGKNVRAIIANFPITWTAEERTTACSFLLHFFSTQDGLAVWIHWTSNEKKKIYQAFLLLKKSAHRALFLQLCMSFFSGYSTKESILYAFTQYYKRYLFAIVTSCVKHKKGGNMVVVMCVAQMLYVSFLLWREDAKFFTKKTGKWSAGLVWSEFFSRRRIIF